MVASAPTVPRTPNARTPNQPNQRAPFTPATDTPAAITPASQRAAVRRGVKDTAQKVVIYGPGGVGKTKLASLLAQVGVEPLFLDLDEGSGYLDVARVEPTPANWQELRDVIHSDLIANFGALVIDSITKAEELAVLHTITTVPHPDKSQLVIKSIEDYGYGKGYQFVFETFLKLLGDLDALARAGKHVVLIAHDCIELVPNPAGEDWRQYQPRLQSPPKIGRIRERVKEWTSHLIYIGYDVYAEKGKGQGTGTRTIYPVERPTHWAKSRSAALQSPIVYADNDTTLWQLLLNRNGEN